MDETNNEWQARHAQAMTTVQTLQVKLDAALQKHQDDAAAHAAALQNAVQTALANQATVLATDHAEAIQELKQTYLIPAQKDLHARKVADLKKEHDATIAQILNA
jgi:hypothetical protein